MLSSKSLLFAALAAVGVASVMARAEIELSEPMPISLDDLPSNASIPAYIKEITQISLRYGLNETRTLCPVSTTFNNIAFLIAVATAIYCISLKFTFQKLANRWRIASQCKILYSGLYLCIFSSVPFWTV